jgi:hypothetical protein
MRLAHRTVFPKLAGALIQRNFAITLANTLLHQSWWTALANI